MFLKISLNSLRFLFGSGLSTRFHLLNKICSFPLFMLIWESIFYYWTLPSHQLAWNLTGGPFKMKIVSQFPLNVRFQVKRVELLNP